jgi:hypothetical protein
VLRGMVNDMAHTKLFEHPSDKTQVVQDVTAVGRGIDISSQAEILLPC